MIRSSHEIRVLLSVSAWLHVALVLSLFNKPKGLRRRQLWSSCCDVKRIKKICMVTLIFKRLTSMKYWGSTSRTWIVLEAVRRSYATTVSGLCQSYTFLRRVAHGILSGFWCIAWMLMVILLSVHDKPYSGTNSK
jgi:hypothetical protein